MFGEAVLTGCGLTVAVSKSKEGSLEAPLSDVRYEVELPVFGYYFIVLTSTQ